MSRKHSGITVAPRKNTVKKVFWGLAFLGLIVWIVQHPHEARDSFNHVSHAMSVLFSRGGER